MSAVKRSLLFRTNLWGPVYLYTALIFWVSSSYRPIPGQEYFSQMDKVCHFSEYFFLGLLLARAFRRSSPSDAWNRVLMLCVIGAALIGTADELYQSFIPMKSTEVADLLADILGGAAGGGLYRFFREKVARTP